MQSNFALCAHARARVNKFHERSGQRRARALLFLRLDGSRRRIKWPSCAVHHSHSAALIDDYCIQICSTRADTHKVQFTSWAKLPARERVASHSSTRSLVNINQRAPAAAHSAHSATFTSVRESKRERERDAEF